MNSDTFKDRLKVAMGGQSNHSFAIKCNISEGSLRNYLKGGTSPDLKTLQVIAEISGCGLAWLASGEGPMKVMAPTKPFYKMVRAGEVPIGGEPGSYTPSEEFKAAGFTGEADVMDDGFVKVPRYRVAASAGHGSIISSEQIVDHLAFRADWVRHALGVSVSSLALINVTGDSMEPTLSNGDLILIDTSISGVDDSGVYVLQLAGALKVKRIHSKADGSVDLISDNNRYPIEPLNNELAQGLNVVGRVVWCGRRM